MGGGIKEMDRYLKSCGVGTYIIPDGKGGYTQINEVVDVDKVLGTLQKGSDELEREGHLSRTTKFKIGINLLKKSAKSIKDSRRRELILNLLKSGTYESACNFHKNAIMIGCMHFMDSWNFDLERVQRCVIHYSTPNGRLIPFCSYNNLHREEVEKKFSVPLKK